MMTTVPEIILGVTGSIGAYRAADLVRHLKDAGYGVTCLMTPRATNFITPMTLQALSERKVYIDLFERDEAPIVHTMLADRAKLVLIAPATANIIGKFANGVADDLVSCTLLATRAKILFAPAMNVHMWQHPSVQRNVTALKRLGYRFVGPDVGKLACGYEAIGHLAEVEEIVRAVKQLVPIPTAAAKPASLPPPRPPSVAKSHVTRRKR
jgi:phosphopantothenoylcysteine decarboxylase/phosphopantothenate--cysteine ligase